MCEIDELQKNTCLNCMFYGRLRAINGSCIC